MKNLFKIGFLAFALSLSLTSCGWFQDHGDSIPIDSLKIDSSKTDSKPLDSNKRNADSVKTKH